MPVVYEDLIESGGRGSSRTLMLTFAVGFLLIVGVFALMLARVTGLL